jgi:S-adenosylmethionine synthetase
MITHLYATFLAIAIVSGTAKDVAMAKDVSGGVSFAPFIVVPTLIYV